MTDAGGEREAVEGRGPDAPDEGARRESIGLYLARQRELRGISIEELCARTKIPRRNIERLESGALDDQPDGFVRGFVRTVAEALGLDADEAVMRLMREPAADAAAPTGSDPRARLLGIGAALAAVAVLALIGGALLRWLAPDEAAEAAPPADSGVTYRVDVVRDLARQARRANPDPIPPPGAPEPGPDPAP